MNNRELALALLEQASELLCESYKGEQKYLDQLEIAIEAQRKRINHISDPGKLSDAEKRLKSLIKKRDYLEHDHSARTYRDNSRSVMEDRKKEASSLMRLKIDSSGNVKDSSDLKKERYYSKYKPHTEGEKKKIDKLIEKSDRLHANINKRGESQNESIAELLIEAAELLNESIFKKKANLKTDYLMKYNNPKAYAKIKPKIAWYEYIGIDFGIYLIKWANLLSSYNKESNSIIHDIVNSKNLDNDYSKIIAKLASIKTKYSKKIDDIIKEIDSKTEWEKVMAFTDTVDRFIKDMNNDSLCNMYLIDSYKPFRDKAKEYPVVKEFSSKIDEITELFYGEFLSKVCHTIKIVHE